MTNFISVSDVEDINALVDKAIFYKVNPLIDIGLGAHKKIGLLFLNPSLRTRISTQVAAQNLGMEAIVFNVDKDGWALEFAEGAIMNGNTVEHIKDAAPVLGSYFDILCIRTFPSLQNREEDYAEKVISQFVKYAGVPIVSLESATLHPLQSLTDIITMQEELEGERSKVKGERVEGERVDGEWSMVNGERVEGERVKGERSKVKAERSKLKGEEAEQKAEGLEGKVGKPKIVLTWAPHIKPLPQCVANSFAQWMNAWNRSKEGGIDFVITHPIGYTLDEQFTKGATITHNQEEALKDADFVYIKNWSSFNNYGAMPEVKGDWMLTNEKLKISNNAKVMHCLPVRRNVELSDELMDGPNSLVTQQGANRVWAAQAVLAEILKTP